MINDTMQGYEDCLGLNEEITSIDKHLVSNLYITAKNFHFSFLWNHLFKLFQKSLKVCQHLGMSYFIL
jgi:hypothetical protein